MALTDLAAGLAVVLIWGVNFVVIKLGLSEVPPLTLTALRFLCVVVPAILFIPRPAVSWRLLAGYGLMLGVVKFGLLFVAMQQGMPAGLSSLVLQVQAFFTILFAGLMLREKPLPLQVAGGALAFLGLGVVATGLGGSVPVWPFAMTIAAAAAWGLANTLMKRAGPVNMLALVVWSSLFAPVPLFALALATGEGAQLADLPQRLTWRTPFALAFLAYPTTIIGFGLFGRLLQRYPAAQVAPLTLLVPLVGMTSGALLLGESVRAQTLVGGALILASLALNLAAPRLATKKGA